MCVGRMLWRVRGRKELLDGVWFKLNFVGLGHGAADVLSGVEASSGGGLLYGGVYMDVNDVQGPELNRVNICDEFVKYTSCFPHKLCAYSETLKRAEYRLDASWKTHTDILYEQVFGSSMLESWRA
jgi:hypothetical protein